MIPIKDNIPTDRFPFVTVLLIIANFVVYVLATRHGGSLISGPDAREVVKYGTIPYALTHPGKHCGFAEAIGPSVVACRDQALVSGGPTGALPAWETVFTSMFVHGSILQLGGNMLFLWIFGNSIEDAMGHVKFIVFYLLGGIAALALQVAIGPNSTAPTIGASGAIAAVLGGYFRVYRRARVQTFVFIPWFFTVIELPVTVMLGAWFVMQALFTGSNFTNPSGGGGAAAYFGQVGAFGLGLITIRLLAKNIKPTPVF